jgi:hypothetical protein
VPRRGDETFHELASHVTPPDFSNDSDDDLIQRASDLVASRLTIAVKAGMIFAELMNRGYTAVGLERLTTLHRRGIGRWAAPFREST